MYLIVTSFKCETEWLQFLDFNFCCSNVSESRDLKIIWALSTSRPCTHLPVAPLIQAIAVFVQPSSHANRASVLPLHMLIYIVAISLEQVMK